MNVRQELHLLCYSHVSARIAAVQATIAQLNDAIANDTKSSAGDKYETSREMAQQEVNLNQANLIELTRAKAILDSVATAHHTSAIGPGSVVHTNRGNYYIAAGIGAFTCNQQKYHTISAASPIGKAMAGLKAKDSFQFNNVGYVIVKVL